MKNKQKIHSIRSKTILTFSIFSVFMIVFMWVFQAIYFSTVYEKVKTSEIEYMSTSISKIYKTDPNFEDTLMDLSFQKNVGIIIFEKVDDSTSLLFNSTREYEPQVLNDRIQQLIYYLDEQTSTSFTSNNRKDFKSLTCGVREKINNKDIYFCVIAPIAPLSSTTDNFKYLLVFISIGVFCATLIGSYCLASQLSAPIVKMANNAKLLTKTNTNVKFNSNEYAEVKQLSDTLNYAIGELQKTDNIRKEVIANVSHELKTPLTMIKSYTELIRDISGNDENKRVEHLSVIYKEAERLEYLLNDMMDYSKLESGVMTYEDTTFNISEILKSFKETYTEKNSDFTFTLTCPKNVTITADKKRIEQVITNLLNNAINYSKDQKEINIRLKKVPNKSQYKLEIVDHGIGISKENLEHVFDRHFRSTSAKRTTVGSGIGLSIVKSILNHYNFEFGVTSTENKGSTFFVVFQTNK